MNDLESKTGYRFLSTHPIYRKNGRVFARVEKISPPRKLGVIELPEKSLESIYKLLQDTNGHVYQHIFEDVDSKSRIVWDETSVDDHWPAWARVNLVSFHKDGNWSVVDPKNNIVFLYDTNIEVFDKFASLTHTFPIQLLLIWQISSRLPPQLKTMPFLVLSLFLE